MEPWSGYIVAVIVILLTAICWRLYHWWRESTSGCLPFTRHLGKRREDEARYCKLCLMVLNICPITLRQIINNFYLKQGTPSFEAFLHKHKEKLFHLVFRRCCCSNVSNKNPMNRSQWDQLFTTTGTAPLHRHHRGDCPCQYKAVPGVVCDVMDITLSCLIIRNLCQGVNMADVDTIRNTRNQLIHASCASLNEKDFNAAWNSVEGAILSLARSLSTQVEADIKMMIQELKDRVMNNADLMTLREQLEKLKKDVSDTKNEVEALQTDTKSTKADVEVLKKDSANTKTEVSALQNEQQEIKAEIRTASERVTELENDTAKTSSTVASQSRQIQGLRLETRRLKGKQTEDFPEDKINKLKEVLYKQNLSITKRVQVTPLQKSAKDLPVELLFAPVSIREDLEVKHTKKKSNRKKTEDDNLASQFRDECESEQKLKPESKLVNTPGDMFYKNGEPARFVFMRGEAGRGKTVYCLRLMQYWCTAKEPGKDKSTLTDWEKGVDEYEFLFRVALRHVHIDRSSLIDMICLDMFKHHPKCHDAICHVLSNDKYRCLVVIDGLDEWKTSPVAQLELTAKCFPNIENISNTAYFVTSRPWKFEEVDESIRKDEATRIIEIHGLDKNGIKSIIKNVLVNLYEMKCDSQEFKELFKDMFKKSQNENFESLMEIPLLVTACVQLWYEGSEVGDSMTSFYIDLVRLLIRRAYNAKTNYETIKEKLKKGKTDILNTPTILQKNRTLADFIVVLCALGDVAYQDLVSQETNLVFQKDDLEYKVGQTEIEFALKAGLLSRCEAPGELGRDVSFSFFHKSMQEFLTAVNIVCRDKVGIESLCIHLTSVKQIMDLSNVIMFTSGLSPSLGSILSQHIVSVTDKDVDVCKYRETFPDHDYDLQRKVRLLYGVQVSCYQEMKHNASTSGSSLQDITYHVAGVYVDMSLWWSDTNTERVTDELLCDPHVNIKSLYVWGVDITDSINTFLHNTTSLQHLRVRGYINLHNVSISDQLHTLKTLYLDGVTLSPDAVCGLQKLLQNNTVLQSLTLERITCRGESGEMIEITLSLNSKLTSLQHLRIRGYINLHSISDQLHSLKTLHLKYVTLHSISDQLHSLKTLHLTCVTLSPDAVCGLQKLLQNNTVLQSLTLEWIACRGESGEEIEITLSLNSMSTSLQHLSIRGYLNLHSISDLLHSLRTLHLYKVTLHSIIDQLHSLKTLHLEYVTLHSISDQLHSLKTLHLDRVTLSPDAVCGLQKSLQNNTVLQSLTLKYITCRGESGEDVPASLCDVLRVLPDSLTTLHIRRLEYKEDIMMLVDVLPRLHHLHSVRYWGEYDDGTYPNAECHAAVVQTLSCMNQLQLLELEDISLGDRSLELTSEMSQIEKVELYLVKMSAGGWNKFVHSLINIPHHFVVTLWGTDIDDESRTMIRSSPCFTVTGDDRYWLHFTRVASSTQCKGKQ